MNFISFVLASMLVILTAPEKLLVVTENAKCPLEDDNLVIKMLSDDVSITEWGEMLSSAPCQKHVDDMCQYSAITNAKPVVMYGSLCYLQLSEKCACGEAIDVNIWARQLIGCPIQLVQTGIPNCLKDKLCQVLKSNESLFDSYRKKFGVGDKLLICQDSEKHLNREKRQAAGQTTTLLPSSATMNYSTRTTGAMTSTRIANTAVNAAANTAINTATNTAINAATNKPINTAINTATNTAINIATNTISNSGNAVDAKTINGGMTKTVPSGGLETAPASDHNGSPANTDYPATGVPNSVANNPNPETTVQPNGQPNSNAQDQATTPDGDSDPKQNPTTRADQNVDVEVMVTVPPVIDASNIDLFLKGGIGSSITADDVQKIDPLALANPKVLGALSDSALDTSMRLALSQKVDEMLSKATVFDPNLFAIGQDLIPPKRFRDLTNSQLESLVKTPNYVPDLDLLPVIGPKVAEILTADISKLGAFKKALISIPAVSYMSILNKQKITNDVLQVFSGSLLSEKQSRDLYSTYLADSEVNINSLDAKATSKLLLSLPVAVTSAVRSTDVKKLDADTANTLLRRIDQSLTTIDALDGKGTADVGMTKRPLAVEFELYLEMKNLSQMNSYLLSKYLLTVSDIKKLGSDACSIITGYASFVGTDPTLVSSIYDQCSFGMVSHCKSLLTSSFGFLTTSEVESLDAKTLSSLCLMQISPGAVSISGSMVQTVVDVIKSLATQRPGILLSHGISAFLPRLDSSLLSLVSDRSSRVAMCKRMACETPGSLPASAVRDKLRFCLENKVPVRKLMCIGEDFSFFFSMVTKDTIQTNLTCDMILPNADLLQSSVIDCQARGAIYSCLNGMNLTDVNDIVQIGSLIDQMSDANFDKIPKKHLCNYLPALNAIHGIWDKISEGRMSAGFKPLNMCPRDVTYGRLMAIQASSECTGASSKRRKREAASVTCSNIYQLKGNLAAALTAAQLGTISQSDFPNCVNILGKVKGFTSEQWTALAGIAKNVYGSDTSKWTSETVVSASGIVTGLSPAEISNLVLDKIEPISAIGSNGLWDADRLSSAFGSVKKYLLNDNVTTMTSPQLRSMGEVICGATVADIASIPDDIICKSFQDLSDSDSCADNQFAEFVKALKDPSCLGADPSAWPSSSIYAMGHLIGGLTKDDLSRLTKEQIRFISPNAMDAIPPMQFNGFTADQLQQFSVDQAARITSSQLRSLDADKQKIIQAKLDSIKSEISLPITGSGMDSDKGRKALILSALMIPLLIAWTESIE